MSKDIQWIVGKLSVDANEIVGKALAENCDASVVRFPLKGEAIQGYFVDYSLVTKLLQIARRRKSGVTFSLFKKEGDKYSVVPFGSHQYKSKKEKLQERINSQVAEIKTRKSKESK